MVVSNEIHYETSSCRWEIFQRTVQHEFQNPEGHGMDKFISWENMLRDYVDEDSIIIEIHADIVSSTRFFKHKYYLCSQIYSGKSFVLKHTFKKICRFLEAERCFSNIEEHYNVPWRLRIQKYKGFLGIHLLCEKEECDGRRWSIQCEYELQLISSKGKCYTRNNTFDFEKPGGNYREVEFINWNVMEEEYMDNDSICVEAHVKILKIQGVIAMQYSTYGSKICTISYCKKYIKYKWRKCIFYRHRNTLQRSLNISKLGEGQSYYGDNEVRYNIPWRLQIFRKAGFLGLNLLCEKEECFGERKWSFQMKFTMKLVSVSGKFFQRTVQHEFQKPEGHGMDKFISWENMLRDYVDKDSIIIEIHADIVSSTGFFDVKYLPNSQPDSNNSFVLKHTFKKISRFLEDEKDYSDLEEHFNIPWRMEIQKFNEFLGIYLNYEKEIYEGRKWSIECEFEFRLISASGKLHSTQNKAIFGASLSWGIPTFISWNDMEKDYVTNDSIDVEIHVKIINVTNSPCTLKSFVLSHTIKNMSSIKEAGDYYTDIQTRFSIPWKLIIQKLNGFFGLYLLCEKQLDESRTWSIETEYQLKIVSTNGRSVSISTTQVFNEPTGYGLYKFMRWDSLEEKYIVDDTLIIEAHVKILNMTGIEDETAVEKPSGIVIPVGDQEYSMEKWLEMAFDH